MWLRVIWQAYLASPIARLVTDSVSAVTLSLFTAQVRVVIAKPDGTLDWKALPSTIYFWVLVSIVAYTIFYRAASFRRDSTVEAFKDESYCKAYVRAQALPELARATAKAAGSGNSNDLVNAIEALKKTFK